MRRLFIVTLALIVTLAASLGAFLFLSLLPYVGIIGSVAAGTVIVGLACVAALMVSFTLTRIGAWSMRRRLLVAGDVVVYLGRNGIEHLSAMHEQAKIPAPAQVSVEEVPEVTDETILELWRKGLSLRTIEQATGAKYHRIQKLTSEAKAK